LDEFGFFRGVFQHCFRQEQYRQAGNGTGRQATRLRQANASTMLALKRSRRIVLCIGHLEWL